MKNKKLYRILDRFFDGQKPGNSLEAGSEEIGKAWKEWKGDNSKDNPFLWTRIEAKLSNNAPGIVSKPRLAWVSYVSVVLIGITIGISMGNASEQEAIEEFSAEYLIDIYDYEQFADITISEDELLYQE